MRRRIERHHGASHRDQLVHDRRELRSASLPAVQHEHRAFARAPSVGGDIATAQAEVLAVPGEIGRGIAFVHSHLRTGSEEREKRESGGDRRRDRGGDADAAPKGSDGSRHDSSFLGR
ncbi:hypothetical protein GCM10007269_05770 [Microbacterium murale]|uniref:Uncharacterized protein n=1 Tax=Microbacterium murale TaxID=1081040 RepID=A0ABQ1RCQ9_9MICO|nr:hypothetical protein GCM10007269_05770 [Microbacterium murale]